MHTYFVVLRAGWKATNWRRIATILTGACGIPWFILEPAQCYFPSLPPVLAQWGLLLSIATLGLGVVAILVLIPQPAQVEFTLKNTTSRVRIEYGDLFAREDSDLVIPVNDYFDSQIGPAVSTKSVHGQFIQRVLDGDSGTFDAVVAQHLATAKGETVEKNVGKRLRYPIGTTVPFPLIPRMAYLVATARTDPQTCIARSSVPQLWEALESLWGCVRTHANGRSVSLPLVGHGFGRTGLEPQHLLRLIVVSLFVAIKEGGTITVEPIRIVLHKSMLGLVDLREIKGEWI